MISSDMEKRIVMQDSQISVPNPMTKDNSKQ